MKKYLVFLTFLCIFKPLHADPIRVAVIDTGLDNTYSKYVPLCPNGHKDFSGEGFNDYHGHGSNVTGLIVDNAKVKGYCIIIIKAYAFKNQPPKEYLVEALEYAYSIKPNIINLSSGGLDTFQREKSVVLKILDSGITLIVAAGNNSTNLDLDCNYYPACYDKRIYVIGNKALSSNYGGPVKVYYNGNNKTAFGRTMSGTSMATALFTADLLKTIAKLKEKR